MRGSGSPFTEPMPIGGVINVITDEGGGRTRGNILLEGGSLGMARGRAQVAGGFLNDRIQYSAGVADTYVPNGVGGDNPFRDTSVQGRVTFHLSPSLRLTARLLGADSFSKVAGSPDALGSLTGFGIVNAIPLSPSLTKLYETGTPLSQINTGNATFIPAPDNPDSTRAARFIDAALHSERTGIADVRLLRQLSAGFERPPLWRWSRRRRLSARRQHALALRWAHSDRPMRRSTAHLGRFNLLSAGYEFENENYAFDTTDQSDSAPRPRYNVTERSTGALRAGSGSLLRRPPAALGGAFGHSFSRWIPRVFCRSQRALSGNLVCLARRRPTPAMLSAAYFFRKTGTKVRAHAGRGYRAPSLYERFGAGFDPVFGYTVYGDPRLRPEHSTSLDAGIDQTFLQAGCKTSASYFYTWRQDVIGFDTSGLINPATDPFGRFIGYLNTQGGISRGVEASAAGASRAG